MPSTTATVQDRFSSVPAALLPHLCVRFVSDKDMIDALAGCFYGRPARAQNQAGIWCITLEPQRQPGLNELELQDRSIIVFDSDRNAGQEQGTIEQVVIDKARSFDGHCVLLNHAPYSTEWAESPYYFDLEAIGPRRILIRINDFAFTPLTLLIAGDIVNLIELAYDPFDTADGTRRLEQVSVALGHMCTMVTHRWRANPRPHRGLTSLLSMAAAMYQNTMQTVHNKVIEPLPGTGAWTPVPTGSSSLDDTRPLCPTLANASPSTLLIALAEEMAWQQQEPGSVVTRTGEGEPTPPNTVDQDELRSRVSCLNRHIETLEALQRTERAASEQRVRNIGNLESDLANAIRRADRLSKRVALLKAKTNDKTYWYRMLELIPACVDWFLYFWLVCVPVLFLFLALSFVLLVLFAGMLSVGSSPSPRS